MAKTEQETQVQDVMVTPEKGKAKAGKKESEKAGTITKPRIETAVFLITGTGSLVINKFSQKAKEMMMKKQAEGGQGTKRGGTREKKDFQALFEGARHRLSDGGDGIPVMAFKNALVRACSIVNFKMTHAKMGLWVDGDGLDVDEGGPLVRIISKKQPVRLDMAVRNDSGVADIRSRPQWREWAAKIRIKFDADMFTVTDVANLLMRAGLQVGVCEGRPSSKNSCGMGWGTFELAAI